MSIKTPLQLHQQDAIVWMQEREKAAYAGGCILDEPGLGKTLQMLGLILSDKEKTTTLVVSPATIMGVWYDEIKKHTTLTSDDVLVYHGRDRFIATTNIYQFKLILTTYSIVAQEFENDKAAKPFVDHSIFNMPFSRVVLDESHHIKNHRTRWSQGIQCLFASSRWINTATPLQNRVGEVHNFMSFLKMPIPKAGPTLLQDTRDLFMSVSLRRTKTSIMHLPVKHERTHWLYFSPAEKRIYRILRASVSNLIRTEKRISDRLIVTLLRLRQCCVDASLVDPTLQETPTKFKKAFDIINACRGEKVVVASQWVKVLHKLHARYPETSAILSGSQTIHERMALVHAFQTQQEPSILFLSTSACAEGITLSAANHVILMDPWWNEAKTLQVADRVHRMTQTKSVFIHKLYMKHSIEEKILQLVQKKSMMSRFIIKDLDHVENIEEKVRFFE